MTSKLVVNTIEADTGISSVSFASSISMNSTAKFHFSAAGVDIGADTNINRPAAGVLGFNINSSEKVRIDSSGQLGIGTNSPKLPLHLHQENSNATFAHFTNSTTGINANQGVSFGLDSNEDATIYHYGSKAIRFATGGTEKVRIDSSGRLLIGTTTEGTGSGDDLTISNTGNMGLTLRSTSSNYCNIYFSDATSGTAEYEGYMSYNHATNSLEFATGHTERLRINSSGQLLLGTTTPGAAQVDTFTLETSGHTGMTLFSGTSSRGTIAFGDGRSGNAQYRGVILYEHSNDSMRFATADTTQMNISSTGQITKPNQASFAVYRNQQSWTIADGGKMNFNTARHNIGNHYDLSNGRFIAPVTGSYQLNFYSILQGNYTNGYIQLKVNGNRIYGGDTHWTLTNNSGSWHNVSYSQVVYLTASQYVEIFSYTGTGSGNVVWHGNNWGCFSGHLIG